MLRRICTLALALVALMAFSVDAFRTSHTRNWRTSLLLMNPIEKLAAVNAELLAKKEGAELVGVKTGGVQPMTRCPKKLIDSKPATVAALLQREGCLSVPGVLSGATADALLAWVNGENERAKREVEAGEVLFDYRFGGVNCRGLNGMFGSRQDMYLPASEPLVRTALREVFTSLRPLLVATVGEEGMLHELSSLVADPGAPRQCVHADTIVLPCPQYPDQSMEPMYTFFVALQDVTFEMGHTVFLPRTHTPAAHLMWNVQQSQKERFLTSLPATSSGLKKGDVAIFDSRVLHCGSANTSDKRRVLFYLTLSRQQRWPLPGGQHGSNSVRVEDRYMHQVKDFL